MFIRAGGGFIPEGYRREGYRVEKPFHEKGLLLRVFREAWFRLHLPFKTMFYNKKVLSFDGECVIVQDPQITREYLLWLQRRKKWKKTIFFYGNMVGTARHIMPDRIPNGIEKWTYERHDSEKYGMRLNQTMYYCSSYCQPKQTLEYDLMYVGRDKGRSEFLFALEKQLREAGLKPFFRVIGNTRFDKKKDPRYGAEMPYDEICKIIAKSKAVLNVTLPNQQGITVRDFEAICNNVKLITTNSAIKELGLYDPSRILVIDKIDTKQIKDFLNEPLIPYGVDIERAFSLKNWINTMR